jgi:transglutaminase-like putative cysteine protease
MISSKDILSYFQEFIMKNQRKPSLEEIAVPFETSTGVIKGKMPAVHEELNRRKSAYQEWLLSEKVSGAPRPSFHYQGPFAQGTDLKPFTGRTGWKHDEKLQALYWKDSRTNVYLEGTVDYFQHEEMIVLNDTTAGDLYDPKQAYHPKYQAGSRSFLEKIAREITEGAKSDRERAVRLMLWISRLPSSPYKHRVSNFVYFLGGTEEEVIKKGALMCNEVARVLCFLAQIMGMPARGVFHFPVVPGAEGHACAEVFFEGKWNWFDETGGYGILRPDGFFANTWELNQDPEPAAKMTFLGQGYAYPSLFTGTNAVVPYNIDDISRYRYDWQTMY